MASSSIMSDFDESSLLLNDISQFKQITNPNNKREPFILYDQNLDREWRQWHTTTSYRQQFPDRKIQWKDMRSSIWEYFIPCLRVQDGKPFVYCKRCEHILEHPTTRSNGTQTLNRHPFSERCKKIAKMSNQRDITEYQTTKKVRHFPDYRID